MDETLISQLCMEYFGECPQSVERCAVGQGNYVFIVTCSGIRYVIRCSLESEAYGDTIYWLKRLAAIEIPVPAVIANGKFLGYEYLILSYLEGKDIGLVYPQLEDKEKRAIAKEIVGIQNRVAGLELENVEPDWSWCAFVKYMLERAKGRIAQNGYFEVEKVERLWKLVERYREYFADIEPIAYLDDISSKNLLVHNGRLSGIIDIDWMGIGDRLTYVALTNMAFLSLGYDTDYVKYILEEMRINDLEKEVFLFYTLMYCVDFMGERGMQFMDKRVEINEEVIGRMNGIYDLLWEEWGRQATLY